MSHVVDIAIGRVSESHLSVNTAPIIHAQLYEFLWGHSKGYKHSPAYQARSWDGKTRFYDVTNHRFAYGLLEEVRDFAKRYNYTIGYTFDIKSMMNADFASEDSSVLDMIYSNPDYQRRDYPVNAIMKAVYKSSGIIPAAT